MSRKRVLSDEQCKAAGIMAIQLERIISGANRFLAQEGTADAREVVALFRDLAKDGLWKYDAASKGVA